MSPFPLSRFYSKECIIHLSKAALVFMLRPCNNRKHRYCSIKEWQTKYPSRLCSALSRHNKCSLHISLSQRWSLLSNHSSHQSNIHFNSGAIQQCLLARHKDFKLACLLRGDIKTRCSLHNFHNNRNNKNRRSNKADLISLCLILWQNNNKMLGHLH